MSFPLHKYLYLLLGTCVIGFLIFLLYPRSSSIPLPSNIDLVIRPSTGPYSFENTTNKFSTYFKSSPIVSDAIKFTNALASISFHTAPSQVFAQASVAKSPTINGDSITYPDLFPQTDLKYSLSPTRLLEEFVIKDRSTAINTTKIIQNASTVNVDNYRQEADGSISFFRGESTAFIIPKPVMYEANNQTSRSYGISYEVGKLSANEFTISKVITQEGIQWLNDPARNYPVVIDLVIDNADTATNWVSSDATNTVVSAETSIKHEGTGSVKVVTAAETIGTTVDLMEYSSDTDAQTAYVTNGLLDDTNTKSLLHMDGADGSTTFTDESDKAWSRVGTTIAIDTAQSVFGGASLYRPSDVSYIRTGDHDDWSRNGNWTIDMRVRFSGTGIGALVSQIQASGSYWSIHGSPSYIYFSVMQSDALVVDIYKAFGGTTNTWYHVTIEKDGSTYRFFKDGVSLGTASDASAIANFTGSVNIGYGKNDTSFFYQNGWIDEFRMSNIVRWTANFTPPTSAYLAALQASSESTIKTQGSYSLKGVAKATNSLNKTLTRTIGSPIDLSNKSTVTFDARSTRTGSNIKVGLHDSGGATTEVTPNITSADTFQEATIDLSGVSNADKDAIDQIIITIVNADADNTFYIDNLAVPTFSSLDDTITLTKSATDLSNYDSISFWIRSDTTGQTLRFQFGETTSEEQTYNITINSADTWEQKIVDISEISASAKDAVTKLAFKITDATAAQTFYFDDITTPTPAARMSGVTMTGVVVNGPLPMTASPGTMADDATVGTKAWTDPNNAKVNDANTAVADDMEEAPWTSHYLKASNFGFTIPTGSTINGIKVEIEERDGSGMDGITDSTVKIIKADGTLGSENKAKAPIWGAVTTYTEYGGTSDLWSETWTPTDINDPDFGVVLSVSNTVDYSAAQVDHIRITVYYTQ